MRIDLFEASSLLASDIRVKKAFRLGPQILSLDQYSCISGSTRRQPWSGCEGCVLKDKLGEKGLVLIFSMN